MPARKFPISMIAKLPLNQASWAREKREQSDELPLNIRRAYDQAALERGFLPIFGDPPGPLGRPPKRRKVLATS